MNIIRTLYHSKFFSSLFHTVVHELQMELKDCESILDLGCGPSSPLQHCKNIKYSLGVEAFVPYLEESKKKKIHSEYINKKIEDIDFSLNSFDAVVMTEVLEHMEETVALETLKKAEKWAKKKVIITSPNGFISQKEMDNNPLQKHLSGWNFNKMKSLGYKSHGLAGFKFLRQEVQEDTMGNNILTSIKFRPKIFWFIIATLSQIICYHFPKMAFELISVKELLFERSENHDFQLLPPAAGTRLTPRRVMCTRPESSCPRL